MVSMLELGQLIESTPAPVTLLESRREIPPKHLKLPETTDRFLSTCFPKATFRSGNATGGDEAFSSEDARIDPARLHMVASSPYPRKGNRLRGAAFDNLTGLIPSATAALFYVDPADSGACGTWHAIPACRRQGVLATA